jgi:mycofactocin precursor peptide peptidase
MTSLADITRLDVRKHGIVLVPIGSTEQHGPHLQLDTDTVIAKAVSERAVALLDGPQVLVTPALAEGPVGASVAQGDLVLESMARNVADQVRTAAGVG